MGFFNDPELDCLLEDDYADSFDDNAISAATDYLERAAEDPETAIGKEVLWQAASKVLGPCEPVGRALFKLLH